MSFTLLDVQRLLEQSEERITAKLGRKLDFDPKKENFVNDAEANAMRAYKRRAPYTF